MEGSHILVLRGRNLSRDGTPANPARNRHGTLRLMCVVVPAAVGRAKAQTPPRDCYAIFHYSFSEWPPVGGNKTCCVGVCLSVSVFVRVFFYCLGPVLFYFWFLEDKSSCRLVAH